MARPNKTGLDYFPFDVDFFADEKIAAISGEFGIKGELTVVKLLCAVYRNGYFILWNEPLKYKLLRDLPGVSPELIDQIVNRLVRWGFFDEGLFDSVKVLTSRGIQKRYFSITRRRSMVDERYILISDYKKTVSDYTKEVIDGKNAGATELLTTKTPQSKGKEIKDISTTTTAREETFQTGDTLAESADTPQKSSAQKVPPRVSADVVEYIPIGEVAVYMKAQTQWLEAFCMNLHLDPAFVNRKIDEFVAECQNNGYTEKDKADCIRHFNSWMHKIKQQPYRQPSLKATGNNRHPATNFNNNQHYDDF